MKMHQMTKRSPLFLLGLLGLTLFCSPVTAQVADGPSDPASFGTVIDAPADIDFQLILNGILESLSNGSACLLYTSPSPRDGLLSRMPSSA